MIQIRMTCSCDSLRIYPHFPQVLPGFFQKTGGHSGKFQKRPPLFLKISSLPFSHFIPAGNEPGNHACMDIWQMPPGTAVFSNNLNFRAILQSTLRTGKSFLSCFHHFQSCVFLLKYIANRIFQQHFWDYYSILL